MATTSHEVDTLLLFVCGAFTLLAVPGLAFFVGGFEGSAGVTRAFRFAFGGAAVVVLLGVAVGHGMLTGPALVPHILGRPNPLAVAAGDGAYELASGGFLLVVCAVAAAIVGVAVSSRLSLLSWLVLCTLWCLFVLFPAGYAVFALGDGWAVTGLGVIDFGGSLPVGVASAASAAGIILASERTAPSASGERSLPLVAIGGVLVWAGWLGLTTGSEGALDRYTALIAVNSFVASAGGCLMWLVVDRVMLRRPTVASVFCGAFSGLVAVTSASGVLTIGWSLLLGATAAVACATTVAQAARFGAAMMLTVVVAVASLVGLLFTGLFAHSSGMVDSGNFDLFAAQGVAGLGVLIGAFTVSLLLALAVRGTLGLWRPVAVRSGRVVPERSGEPADRAA